LGAAVGGVGTTRRLTAAAGLGGGLGATLGGLFLLLRGEAKLARRAISARTTKELPPSGNGVYGRGRGKPLVLAVLGDSTGVGLGVHRAAETPGVLLAAALAELAERPVRLANFAVSGAESRELPEQVEQALAEKPDAVLIMIGANDVTSRTRPAVSVAFQADAVRQFRAIGAQVVVATCPDLGTIRPIAQPLRQFTRRWSRQMAAAQTVAVVEAGGRTVSLGSILGPTFARDRSMFGDDEFHPSRHGYAAAAAVILPSLADALGFWPAAADRGRRKMRRDTVRPIERAAARAAGRTGTEVQPTEVRGSDTGPLGAWARLRRRRPPELPTADQAERAEQLQVP
jgi:lysophospholipase L1-like esterase